MIYATATGDNALVLVNITNPLNLNFIGEYVDTGFLQDPKHVAIKGNIGFITSATNDSLVAVQLQGIDTPTLNTGTFTTDNGYVSRNLVIGNDLYVDNGMHSGTGGIFTDGGLTVKGKTSKSTFDVDLSYVYSFSNATALDGINGLYIQGDYGYFVRGSIPGGFGIIDMTSKQNLSVISYIESDTNFDNPNTPIAIGDYVFVNSYDDDQVTAVYVGNKTNPVVVDTLKDGTELNGAYHSMVSGNVLYVTGKLGNSVNSIDITDPHNMVFLDQILDNTYLDSPAKFDIQGNYMFVPNYDDNSMTSIDISDPTNMKVVSELIDAASLSTGYEIKVSGRYAYHSGRYGGEITVVDISNPASMKVVYVYNDPSSNYNWKEIVGNRLIYYDNNGNDMFVMDISNPLNWKIERTFDMDGLGAHYTDGRYMYVMYPSGDEIRVYDIGGIDTPALTTGNIQADYGRVSKNFEIGDDLFVHKNLMAGSLNTIGNLNMNGTAFINSKVGIGIRSPTDPLHIKADSGHDNIHLEEHSGIEDWQIGVDADGDLNFEDSGTTVVTFEDGGFVGIGTDDPGRELTVVGDINTTGKIFAYKPTTSDVFTVTADSGHRAFSVFTSGNAQPSMYLLGTGFYMGDGTNPYDIELRRGSANTIYTPDDIGIGMTNTPYSNLWINSTKTTAGLVVARTTTPPLFQALGYGTDNVYLFFDSYYDGGFKSSDSGSNFMISKNSDQFKISHDSGVAVGGANSYDVGFAMKSDGEVLIDKTTDSGAYDLQVNGEICETTAGTQACSSDERLKENIIPLKQENSLDLIMQLEPKEFNFIGDNKTVSGFIAQDIQEIRPDWIIEHDDDEYITFDDKGYMQTSIVKSIQEQQEMIEQQEQLLAQQQTQIDELKTIICIDHPDAEMCK